jgi:hypothetical protein
MAPREPAAYELAVHEMAPRELPHMSSRRTKWRLANQRT